MRQGGIIAGAGLYALEHHIERLALDHSKAKVIEDSLKVHPQVEEVFPVETNIIVFKLKENYDPNRFVSDLEKKGILSFALGDQTIRFVFHLDISEQDVQSIVQALKEI